MKLPLYQVDAFTTRLFGGNPAAVVLLDRWLPDETLLAIAAENNLSETAFVIPRADVSSLRWFTPTLEIDLCGHATLGAAYVLFRYCFPSLLRVAFSTRSGDLVVSRAGELLRMDFPSRPGRPLEISDELVAALGERPREALLARDLLAVFDSEDQVRTFRPDLARIASLDAFALIVSAPGESVDFVSRFFAPRAGVPEDPVTGSAHCTLVPYWAGRLGKSRLVAKQLSVRGGDLLCEIDGERVILAGSAVEYLRGEIEVPRSSPQHLSRRRARSCNEETIR
jgi:predicted PhzF superfamily epimerase YddE/YHI9